MTRYAISYVATLAVFVTIDLMWLGWIAKSLYLAELGKLVRSEPNLVAAAIFYLLYAGGLVLFAVIPGLKAASAMHALAVGGALGLIAYGTYDLTNLAMLNGFSLKIALIDMVWGTILSGATAALVVALISKMFSH